MKNIIYTLLFVLMAHVAVAQVPQKIMYQTVGRDKAGKVLVNGQIKFQISLHRGAASAAPTYTEIHIVTTNKDGLATMEVGAGSVTFGNFSTIDWNSGPIFLRSKVELFGTRTLALEGVMQLTSAPYALYAGQVHYDSLLNKPDLTVFVTTNELSAVDNELKNTLNNKAPVRDYDGNEYEIVQVGNKFWFTSNLRVTHFNDGTKIPLEVSDSVWTGLKSNPAYCWPNNDSLANFNLGALYNFKAVNTNKLCPIGFHVPSKGEMDTLALEVGGKTAVASQRIVSISDGGQNTTGLNFTDVGNITAGQHSLIDLKTMGETRYMSSSDFGKITTGTPSGKAFTLTLTATNGLTTVVETFQNSGLPVRCVKN